MEALGRRAFLQAGAAALLPAGPAASSRSDLSSFLVSQIDEMARVWDAKRERITTPAQLEARNRDVRRLVRAMIGALPPPAPIRAEVTAIARREGYRIENLLFESRPGLWVSGNLYIPDGAGPFPAVLSPCGHYELARMYPDYQLAYIDLALSGFVVLAYDPPGQGERRQYWNRARNANADPLRSVDEHSMAGHLLLLLGDSLTGYTVQDGIRGIDYLITRPEVDSTKIACAGHSGGGTLAMFLACVDERIRCAVINEGGTARRWPVTLRPGGALPVPDAEQNLFPAAMHGIDTCDLHAAIAPRPLLALVEEYGEAFNRSAAQIRARYELLGAGNRFETGEAKARHAWTGKLRLATVDFCSRRLLGRAGPEVEPGRTPEPPKVLLTTPEGSLRDARKGSTLFAHISARAASIDAARPAPRSRAEVLALQKRLRGQLPELLRIRVPGDAAPFRVLDSTTRESLTVQRLEITPEPGIVLAASAFLPAPSRRSARPLLLVSSEGLARQEPFAMALAQENFAVLSLEPRGIQEPSPDRKPFGHLFDDETGCAYLAWSLDRDLFGMRVFDILASCRTAPALLKTASAALSVIGTGDAALWGLCAAALDAEVAAAVCHGGLVSWRALLDSDRYLHGAGTLVRGVFPHCDLPQIAAAIAPRRLVISSPLDAMRRPAAAADCFAFTASAYSALGAADRFLISPHRPEPLDPGSVARWVS